MRTSKLLLLIVLLVAASLPCRALTTVTDTLTKADGTAYTGNFKVSWATFTTTDNRVIRAGYVTVIVTGGVFTTTLEPSGTCIAYVVEYTGLRQGDKQTEYWSVPTGGPVGLSTVRTPSLPICPTSSTFLLAALSSGGAVAGQALVWNGTVWAPGLEGVLCAFTAQTSVTCLHSLNTTNIAVEVQNAAGDTIIPAFVHRSDANTVVFTFDSATTGTARVL